MSQNLVLQTDVFVSDVNQIELNLFSYCFFFFIVINIFHLFHLLTIVSFLPFLWFFTLPICPFPTHSSYCFLKNCIVFQPRSWSYITFTHYTAPVPIYPRRIPFSDVFSVWGLLELLFKECLVWTLTWRVFLGFKNKSHWEKVHCPVAATYRSRCGPK